MRIVGRDKLDKFCRAHADARSWVGNWIFDAETARWTSSHEIKRGYASASFLPGNMVVFNIKGNRYRLEAQIAYNASVVVIRWVGTHAEYMQRLRGNQ